MSRLFDFNLSGVKVFPESPALSGSTQAVTKNGEIHFRPGAYQPGTPGGDWLIAHELAHVVQQRGGLGERTGTRKELEREADRAATRAMYGQAAPIQLRAQATAAYAFRDGEAHDGGGEAAHDQIDPGENHEAVHAEPPDHGDHGEHAKYAEPAHTAGVKAHEAGADPDAVDLRGEAAIEVVPGEAAATAPAVGGGPAAKPGKTPPNVASAKPEAGLSQARGVHPNKLTLLFGQIRTSASTDAAEERAKLAANPPKQMSTGAKAASASSKAAGSDAKTHAKAGDKAGAEATHDKANPKAAKDLPDHPVKGEGPGGEAARQAQQGKAETQQQAVTQVIAAAKQNITSWFGSLFGNSAAAGHGDTPSGQAQPKMSDAEVQQMSGSLDRLPTKASDVSTDAGPAPALAMQTQAKDSADQDRAKLVQTATTLESQGRADSRAPMGEDHIETTVAPEELTAVPKAAAVAPVALPSLADAAPSEEVGIIAQEQQGAEIDAALATANGDVTTERGKHSAEAAKARAEADAHVQELKTKVEADQAVACTTAQAEVQQARGQWQAEVDKQGSDARKQADKKVADGMAQVASEEAKANAEAKKHIDDGQKTAEEEKQKGEKAAADAKAKGKEKSSRFFGWIASKAKAAFDGIKKAVSAAIDACRKAIKAVLDAAKKLAMAAIDLARKAINATIKAIGEALNAISDVLLAAFPALKAKFQGLIRKAVDKATAAVNKLADGLKQAVQNALDLLGAALDKALQLLAKGINAIIDAANAVVQGAIKAAQAVAAALGTWVKLIKDVASGPMAWLGKLGAAVVDGIKHHLWSAFKTAVVEWFKGKVFELLGVGGIILQLLLEGGLTKEAIIQMALDALMVAIPAALVAILIEKLVSMIVPAAGAVMAIIEGLQAAWGTISRIIAAFGAFLAFLLAVKGGSAGALFAVVLASAAVVVLDFVANWLLKRLASAARKVGAKLKGMAETFKAKRKATKDAKAAKQPKDHDKKAHDDPKAKEAKDKKNQEILAKAERELLPKIQAALQKRPNKLVFRARLLAWRVQYKLTSLTMLPSGNQFRIEATVNPKKELAGGYEYEENELLAMLKRVGDRLLRENPAALERTAKRADALGIDPQKAKSQRAYAPETAEERLAIAAHQKHEQPNRDPRDRTLVHHGKVEDGSHVRSVHEKPGGEGKRKQGDELVRSVNEDESASNAKRYKELAKILEDRGITAQQLGEAMRLMSRGISSPAHMKGSEKELGELMGLFFGTEVSRDSRNAVHSMMAIEQLEKGGKGTTISGTFERLPAEMKGHVKATQALDADLAGQPRPETRSRPQQDRDVTELKTRQLERLKAWFQTQIAGGRTPLSTSIQDLETFVEDMVRRFIRSYKR